MTESAQKWVQTAEKIEAHSLASGTVTCASE